MTTANPSRRFGTSTGDGMAQMMLRSYLAAHPDIAFATWTAHDGRAVIDLLRVPYRLQRRGVGTRVYRLWEATLAEGTTVELFAVDADASAFWRTLGFEGETNGLMRKTIAPLAIAA